MKQKRFLGLVLALGLLGLLVAGCARTSTRGWAAPVLDNQTQVVSPSTGKLDGINAAPSPKPAWTGKLTRDLGASETTITSQELAPTDTVYLGDLLHIDSETMRVSSLNVSGGSRKLTLERGAAGTTAAAHGTGSAVDASRRPWRFPDDWQIPDKSARSLKGFYGQPVVDKDGVTFVADYNGYLYAFRPSDVNLDASKDSEKPLAASLRLQSPIVGGPVLDSASGTLYVPGQNSVYGVSASDMKARITNRDQTVKRSLLLTTGKEVWATPVIDNGTILVASLDGMLYAVDGQSGSVKWQFDAGNSLVTTPVVASGHVLVGGFDNQLFAVNLSSGQLDWSAPTSGWVWGAPSVKDGIAYFGDFSGVLHAVNLSDGSEAWSVTLNRGTFVASPTVVANRVVIGSDDGWLMGVDTSSRATSWEKDLGTALRAPLVSSDNLVLLAPEGCVTTSDSQSKVYYRAVDPSNGDLKSAEGVC